MAHTSTKKTVIPKCDNKNVSRAVKKAQKAVDLALKQIVIAISAADDAAEALTTASQAAYDIKDEKLGDQLNKRGCEWEDFGSTVEDLIP